MRKIIDTANELGCSFSWIPHWANQVADQLAKQGAKHLASFVGDFLPPWLSNVFFVIHLWRIAYTSCIYQLIEEWKCLFLIKKRKKNCFCCWFFFNEVPIFIWTCILGGIFTIELLASVDYDGYHCMLFLWGIGGDLVHGFLLIWRCH